MIRRPAHFLFIFLFFLPLASSAAASTVAGKVLWIYDGDTIKVENVGKVRLIGIDAPERKDSERDNHYLQLGIERTRLRQTAQEALQFMIDNVKNRIVTLQTDQQIHDRHGRLLAYVYLPDGQLLNRKLVEKGLAAVYRRFDFRLKNDFLQSEETARRNQVGLWK